MATYCGTVVIKKKDQSERRTVHSIMITGVEHEDMKRNPINIKRALRFMKDGIRTEDPTRWVIIDIIIHRKL